MWGGLQQDEVLTKVLENQSSSEVEVGAGRGRHVLRHKSSQHTDLICSLLFFRKEGKWAKNETKVSTTVAEVMLYKTRAFGTRFVSSRSSLLGFLLAHSVRYRGSAKNTKATVLASFSAILSLRNSNKLNMTREREG